MHVKESKLTHAAVKKRLSRRNPKKGTITENDPTGTTFGGQIENRPATEGWGEAFLF